MGYKALATRPGFYLPTMLCDAINLTRRCEKYQRFTSVSR